MRYLLLAVGILGGVIPSALFAQESGSPPEASPNSDSEVAIESPSASPGPGFEDLIVVTGSLEPQELGEGLTTVTVIPRSEIEARQVYFIDDALRTVPGVSSARTGGPGKAVSFFLRGANSNQALVLWNGLPLNDPFFGAFDGSLLTTDGADRIEVVRGPLSTVYGSSAVGGVIQLISGTDNGFMIRGEAGEDGHSRVSSSLGWNLGATTLDLVGAWATDDGVVANDDYDLGFGTGRLLWEAEESLSLGLLIRGLSSEIGIPRSGVTPTPNRRQDSDAREIVIPAHGVGDGWRWRANLGSANGDFLFRDPDASFSVNDTETTRQRARAVVSWDWSQDGWLAFGGEWSEEEASNESNFGSNLDEETQRNSAAFAQAHWSSGDVTIEGGLRYDDSDTFGSQSSPSFAIAWAIQPQLRLRAGWAESFRAPSLGELFFPFSGNPDLQPESASGWEVALEGGWGQNGTRWNAAVVAFDNRVDDLIEFDFVTFRNVNIGEARSRGAEAWVGWFRGPWSGRLTSTWLDAEDRRSGEALLRRADEEWSLEIGWAGDDLSTRLTAFAVGERPDVDPVTFTTIQASSYARVDWALRWQARQNLAPYLRIDNLFDEDYEEAAGFPAPGRRFIAGLELRLGR
ncbi:MAG: TonB-dependent receptor [Acidobacteriota bacterium]